MHDVNREKADVIKDVCNALLDGHEESARHMANDDYPFHPFAKTAARWSAHNSMRIFIRDGFIDRYSGAKLVFPGLLRALSLLLPHEFPYHAHGKMSEAHLVHWELYPSVDHVEPLSRGGEDDEDNCVTTSMLKNMAKSSWTLEELGWDLWPSGDYSEWDGLVRLYLELVKAKQDLLNVRRIKIWHNAALKALKDTQP